MRLEVGVGTTDFQRLMVPSPFLPKIAGRDVVYMDLTRPDISIENFIRGDAEHLPFKTESFSLICASHVIEHLAHLRSFWQNVGEHSSRTVRYACGALTFYPQRHITRFISKYSTTGVCTK